MKHYDTLGITPEATPEQLKAAYRRAAGAAHPDREGGSTERMAAVNQAWEILGDPERRARYDECGDEEKVDPIDQLALDTLIEVLQNALNDQDELDIPGSARRQINARMAACRLEISKAKGYTASFNSRRKLVRRKGEGENLVHGLIDARLDALAKAVAANQKVLEVCERALPLLAEYEFTGEVPAVRTTEQILQGFHARHFNTTGTAWGGI